MTLSRLLERTARDPQTDCWRWRGATDKDGYGIAWLNGSSCRAHRAVWILARGALGPAQLLLHNCDQPDCVNLDHLRLGTQAENIADMVAKRRQACGERTRHAKLTVAQVLDIRASVARGRRQIDLARRYHVTGALVSAIVKRKIWRHIS